MRVSNSAGFGLALAMSSVGLALGTDFTPCCTSGVTVVVTQTTVRILEIPVTIDAYIPVNTNIVIDKNLTIEVTNAPTHLKTEVTETECTSITTTHE